MRGTFRELYKLLSTSILLLSFVIYRCSSSTASAHQFDRASKTRVPLCGWHAQRRDLSSKPVFFCSAPLATLAFQRPNLLSSLENKDTSANSTGLPRKVVSHKRTYNVEIQSSCFTSLSPPQPSPSTPTCPPTICPLINNYPKSNHLKLLPWPQTSTRQPQRASRPSAPTWPAHSAAPSRSEAVRQAREQPLQPGAG